MMELFQKELEKQFATIPKEDRQRTKAWDHFLRLGLPTKDTYRYIKLRNMYQHSFSFAEPKTFSSQALERHILPECRQAVLVFVNGDFRPELSTMQAHQRVILNSLKMAQKTYGAFLNNHWAKFLKEETDPLTAVNAALHREGAFLYLPPKTCIETPIQVLFVSDTEEKAMHMLPRLTVFCGAESTLTIITTHAVLSGASYCFNSCAEVMVEEGARVHVYQLNDGTPQEAWHFDAWRATLKRDAVFQAFSFTDGCAAIRNDYRVALKGENADVQLNGIWMLQKKREAHTHVLIDHQAPHCRSTQLYKGILNDHARSSFEGKILVKKEAQKTNAFQLNRNLLLSDSAQANSQPNLEIFADDVKASHGATVGQLDGDQLFYLQTRGYSSDEAKKILVNGFCQEVIASIPFSSLKALLSKKIERHLFHASA